MLQDYHLLENAIGKHLPRPEATVGRLAPGRFKTWLYRFCLERGYLDSMLTEFIVTPFVRAVPLVRCHGAALDRLPDGQRLAGIG